MAHDIAPDIQRLAVSTRKVKPHPQNPRVGQVEVIAESLAQHGQYRPIIAQRSTGYVLAGNHTLQAAKKLGWDRVAVVFVDVDDDLAARIVLADNRTSDLGTYDTAGLLDLLEGLPGLEGTGWDAQDVDLLHAALEASLTLSTQTTNPKGKIQKREAARISVGRVGLVVPSDAFDRWQEDLEAKFPDSKPAVIAWMRFQLKLPVEVERKPVQRKTRTVNKASAAVDHPALDDLKVPIDSLVPADDNARQGDVGAIAESLTVNGQYRPIVVNRATMEVLAGNHTLQAAKALGWTEIAATFVDVDDEEARRILLVDNRAADLAGYDESVLAGMLARVSTWEGTGFESADVEALLAGYGLMRDDLHTPKERRPADVKHSAPIHIGPYLFSTPQEEYERWEYERRVEVGHEPEALCKWVVDALGLPAGWAPWRMLNSKGRKNRED